MTRRPLWQTLSDVVGGLGVPKIQGAGFRVSGFCLDLPMEVLISGTTDDLQLYADVPRWRWTTDFDQPISRLKVAGEQKAIL